ncbi:ParB/RepB/Spo0J family partition protein [Pseudomonas aeruginosa]|uniref:ParB/RepB/Spo0J family partition protein n=1 Tax=Pseudomonas aeruginosa TaxID=287 RepID=UPI0034E07268
MVTPEQERGTTERRARRIVPKQRQVQVLAATRFDIRSVPQAFKHLPVELLRPGMFQTRRNFKPKALKELATSLETAGSNITPLIVRPLKHSEGYEIIGGERRWRAAQLIGMPTLLCCIGDFTDAQAMYLSAVDNIQREGINPIEEAESYNLLLLSGMTHKDVADDIGKSRTHVTNYTRLLSLPLAVRDMLGDERLSYAQARPLCSLSSPGLQANIAREAVQKQWSSKRIADEVSKLKAQRRIATPKPIHGEDVDVKRLRDLVAEQTGYPCVIVRTQSGGWQLGLHAGSADEFQGILERLGVNTDQL